MNVENSSNMVSSLLSYLTISSIECIMRLISIVAEIANQKAPMARDNVHAITKNSYSTMTNCMKTAIRW